MTISRVRCQGKIKQIIGKEEKRSKNDYRLGMTEFG